jgi:site-specific recombinase XerD
VLVLALHTGLRRAELADLEVGDVDLTARTVFVRHGKGGHARMVPLSIEAGRAVAAYLASEGLCHGPFVRSLREPQEGITPEWLGQLFSDLAYRSGVKVRSRDGVSQHATRHTFATDVYEQTDDVLAVRDLLGHESLATTQIYVRGMNVERLRPAVEGRTYMPDAA